MWLSREIDGDIKTLTVKRDSLGDIYILITSDDYFNSVHTASGKNAGMDFGLKTFLTMFDDSVIDKKYSPLYFLASLNLIRKRSRELSSKKKGSNHRKQAVLNLARLHRKIYNQRLDFFFKLSLSLSVYDNVFIEDLNLKAMQRLWGRKVSDVAYNSFINILSSKTNVVKIDRFYPSSKTCSECNYIKQDLKLSDRQWICPVCHTVHDRDENASKTVYAEGMRILRVGTSTLKSRQCKTDFVRNCRRYRNPLPLGMGSMSIVISFIISGIPVPGLKWISAEAVGTNAGSPALSKPAQETYSYAGMIANISSSSITLYHGVTCIITGATVCKAPMSMSGGNMMNMQTVSCSSFTKGETVQISAVKNSSGQLVAVEIQEAFF